MVPAFGSSGPVCCFDRNDAVKDSFKILTQDISMYSLSQLSARGLGSHTRATVARFNRVSSIGLSRFVGHSNDSARPSGLSGAVSCPLAEYSCSLALDGKPHAIADFMITSCTDRCKCFCFNTQTDKGSLHRRNRKQPKQARVFPSICLLPQRASLTSLLTRVRLKESLSAW